jgi:flagellin-like hook-associated protein FlgL
VKILAYIRYYIVCEVVPVRKYAGCVVFHTWRCEPVRINNNVMSYVAYNAATRATNQLSKAVERLSTGLRINKAADDAAGLAISEKMTSQIRGLDQASRNAQDGISLLNTAEGALNEIHSIMQRMRELSVQAANDTLTTQDRSFIKLEIDELTKQIDAVAFQTQFNKKRILNGDAAILWSTSSSNIGLIIAGTLLSKDRFGQINNAEGNYRITFDTPVAGAEQIQKSNIMYLKHGTHESNVVMNSLSSMLGLNALNMVEGVWRIEARESPFGGIHYFHEGEEVDAAVVEALLEYTGSDLAAGEYDIRVSDLVPFMASFDTEDREVYGIEISQRTDKYGNAVESTHDAVFVLEVTGGQESVTKVARKNVTDGGDVFSNDGLVRSILNDLNLFTYYEVTNTDQRDTLTGTLEISTDYVAPANGEVTVELDYQTAPGNEVTATLEYVAAADQTFNIESAFIFDEDDVFTFGWTDGDGNNRVITVGGGSGDGSPTDNGNLVGLDMDQVWHLINERMESEFGDNFEYIGLSASSSNNASSQTRIELSNQTGFDVTIGGNAAYMIGLSGVVLAGADKNGSYMDRYRNNTVSITAGDNLTTIVGKLNTAIAPTTRNIRAEIFTDLYTGKSTIQFVQNDPLNSAVNYKISFGNYATAGVLGDLGLTGLQAGRSTRTPWDDPYVPGVTDKTNFGADARGNDSVYENLSINTLTVGAWSLTEFEKELEDWLLAEGGVTGFDAYSPNDAATQLSKLTLANNSKYKITLDGSAITELYGSSVIIDRNKTVASARAVYEDAEFTYNVNNMSMQEIYDKINDLNADAAGSYFGPSDFFPSGSFDTTTQSITLNNPSVYKITVGGNVGRQLWNPANPAADFVMDRGAGPATSIEGKPGGGSGNVSINIDGKTIEEVYNMLQQTNVTDLGLYVGWAPGYNGSSDIFGQLILSTNVNGKRIQIQQIGAVDDASADQRKLFASNTTLVEYGASKTSQAVQSKDALDVTISWEGNYANGAVLPSGHTGTVRLYEDYDNANIVNSALKSANASVFNDRVFDNFTLEDSPLSPTNPMHFNVGDNWMLFSSATVSGATDTLKVKLYDQISGINYGLTADDEIIYNFTHGSLDGGLKTINQMTMATNTTGYNTIHHKIEFGEVNSHSEFSYGQRAGAGDADAWGMGGSGDRSWYGQAYYGDDTTYYFANNNSIGSVVKKVEVDRQNDINASLVFTYNGDGFTVSGSGYDRSGVAVAIADAVTQAQIDALKNGSLSYIEILTDQGDTIRFTSLDLETSGLDASDDNKFVINVAAAAKMDSPGMEVAGKLVSNENVSVDADLARSGGIGWNSRTQYRFANGATPGTLTQVEGNILDRYTGSDYAGNSLDLSPTGSSFPDDSTVGAPGVPDKGSYWIRAEVNSSGTPTLDPDAFGDVTSVYIKDMERNNSALGNFIGEIKYSNLLPDGSTYNPYNASLIFDVLEVRENGLLVRLQGHIMDTDGNYAYGEDEELFIAFENNANLLLFPPSTVPDSPSDEKDDDSYLHNSGIPGFQGLYFNEFNLLAGNWAAGDRFTVGLTASATGGGTPKNDMDEITLLSDNRGTGVPQVFRFKNGTLNGGSVKLRVYQLANNMDPNMPDSVHFRDDQVMDGTLSMSFGGTSSAIPAIAQFSNVYEQGMDAGVAHYYSRLEDIKQFWDANGNFLLGNGPEQMTIKQDDREITVNIYESDELGKLALNISNQIWASLLRQSGFLDDSPAGYDPLSGDDNKYMFYDEQDRDEIFQFVNTVPGLSAKTSGIEAVVGAFLAHSVLPGADKAISFYFNNENLMKAFGFATIQEAVDSEFTANVTDAHTGAVVSSGTRIRAGSGTYNIITPGALLDIDGDAGIIEVNYDDATGNFVVKIASDFEQFVHLADNALMLQIGANQGENTILVLGDMSAKALGINNLEVRSREDAARSITRLDSAIKKVSTQRAVIGAQINRLEHTINNLTTASTNLNGAKSRIKDTDFAKEMMTFTRINILQQAGLLMQAQANQINRNILTLMR